MAKLRECRVCGGDGYVTGGECPICKGEGTVPDVALPRIRPTKPPIKIQKRGGHGVDYKIHDAKNIPGELWWSPPWDGLNGQGSHGGFNSYVVCEVDPRGEPWSEDRACWKVGDKWVRLYSINGIGEIRWGVYGHDIEAAERAEEDGSYKAWQHEGMEAAKWFGLEPK